MYVQIGYQVGRHSPKPTPPSLRNLGTRAYFVGAHCHTKSQELIKNLFSLQSRMCGRELRIDKRRLELVRRRHRDKPAMHPATQHKCPWNSRTSLVFVVVVIVVVVFFFYSTVLARRLFHRGRPLGIGPTWTPPRQYDQRAGRAITDRARLGIRFVATVQPLQSFAMGRWSRPRTTSRLPGSPVFFLRLHHVAVVSSNCNRIESR